jgi:hypothetical protein
MSHQCDEGWFRAFARAPIPIVTNAATADMSTTANAMSPRFTHPNNKTGVKYRPTTAAGATAGKAMCRRNLLMVGANQDHRRGAKPPSDGLNAR